MQEKSAFPRVLSSPRENVRALLPSFAPFEHAFEWRVGCEPHVFWHRDFRRHVFQAVAERFRRVHFHKHALVARAIRRRPRNKFFARNFVLQARNHVRFRDDYERFRARFFAEIYHFFRAANDVCAFANTLDTFWVHENGRARELLPRFHDFLYGKKHVCVARARPKLHFALRLLRDPRAEILIRNEENFPIRGNVFDDFFRVSARANNVCERFYRRAAIDVCDDVKIRIFRLVCGELGGVARIRERATRLDDRQQNRSRRIYDFRGLRHKMHAAKHDYVRVFFRFRLIREPERIAHVIRHALDFRALIIVHEKNRVVLFFQTQNLFLYRREWRKRPVVRIKNF